MGAGVTDEFGVVTEAVPANTQSRAMCQCENGCVARSARGGSSIVVRPHQRH